MCGIVGYCRPAFGAAESPTVLSGMLGRLAHRGPDEHGYYFDDTAALGVARLTVLDAVGGKQPFADAGQRYWLAYNGEIYNFEELRRELIALGRTFRTRSDTEVVLAAWLEWGEAALARFNGGFAFAVYDRLAGELALARDRFGKRPLFYTAVGGALVFASEMKAFLAYPGGEFRWHSELLSSLVTVWTPLPDSTPFAAIRQVPPGTTLHAAANGSFVSKAVSYDLGEEPFDGSFAQAEEMTRCALAESVRQRLRSDVEVGVYLSGGLDSAIVAYLAAQHGAHPLQTFSVSFEEPSCDESDDQRLLSTLLGSRHSTLRVDTTALTRGLAAAVLSAEVPVFRTALVPMFLLSELARERGIEVVLTGEGADEAFLGYDIFKETLLRSRWNQTSEARRRAISAELYRDHPHLRAGGDAAFAGVLQAHLGAEDPDLYSHQLRFANGRFSQRLLREPGDGLAALRGWIAGRRAEFDRLDLLGRAQWLETATLLTGYLLSSQGDRVAFAHGVENRCPFLDPSVMALAARLPSDWRLKDGVREKAILRRAFAGGLPTRTLDKPKRPYVAPDAAVAAGGFARSCLDSWLSREELARIDVVNPTFARRLAERLAASSPASVSPRETQAFLLLLSLAMLDRYFVRRDLAPQAPRGVLTIAEDGRRLPAAR